MTTGKTVKLSKAQRRFLQFHAYKPWPHKWAWIDDIGTLCAWKWQDGRLRQCSCQRNELIDLRERNLLDALRVTPAGRAALKGEK